MAEVSLSGLKDRLNTRLGDPSDRTFTSSEKSEFLTTGIDDQYSYDIVRDSSNRTVAMQPGYDISGTGITDVTAVYVDILGNGYPQPVDRNSYDVVQGTLYFDSRLSGIPDGKTLIVEGKYKLTVDDTVPDFIQDYILTLAEIAALQRLSMSYTTRFLKNDVTLAEIQAQMRQLMIKRDDLRKTLHNRREVRG